MRRLALVLLAVLPGFAAVCMCAMYLGHDWPALERAFRHLETAADRGNLAAIASAGAVENALRLNCFAEGVGLLLGAILAAVGVHGLCMLPPVAGTAGSPASGPALNGDAAAIEH